MPGRCIRYQGLIEQKKTNLEIRIVSWRGALGPTPIKDNSLVAIPSCGGGGVVVPNWQFDILIMHANGIGTVPGFDTPVV